MKRDMIYKDLIQLDMEAADTDDFFDKMAAKLEELGFVRAHSWMRSRQGRKTSRRHWQ